MSEEIEDRQHRHAPVLYTSAITVATSGTDIKIVFEDTIPAGNSAERSGAEKRQIAVVSMSFHTCKDLLFLLNGALTEVEGRLGPINTPFLQAQRANRPK